MSRENKMKIKMEPTEVNEDFPKKIKLEEIDLKHSQFDEKVKKEPTLFCDLLDEPQTQRFDEISEENSAVLSKKLELSENENQKLSQKFEELDQKFQKLDQKFKKMKEEKMCLEKKLQNQKNLKRKIAKIRQQRKELENLLLKMPTEYLQGNDYLPVTDSEEIQKLKQEKMKNNQNDPEKKVTKDVDKKVLKKVAKELDKKVDQNLQKHGRFGIKIENAKV